MDMEKCNVIYVWRYCTSCGELLLGSLGERLCLCNWVEEKHPGRVERRLRERLRAEFAEGETEVVRAAARELDEYFSRRRRQFDVPLLFAGSGFQEKVWRGLMDVPYGETVTYGELAQTLDVPKSVRAVANANGANAISIFVPCHRVIGRDGSLTGYGGGLAAKKFLLEMERGVRQWVR